MSGSRRTLVRGTVLQLPYKCTGIEEEAMAVKDRRREVRLSAHDDDLVVEAAGLAGVSVSEFLLDRAIGDAEALVAAHRTILLAEPDYAAFLAALDEPNAPPAELVSQVQRARRLTTGPR